MVRGIAGSFTAPSKTTNDAMPRERVRWCIFSNAILVYRIRKETVAMKLDNQILALIAVGASVTANCQPCLEHNTATAAKCGADPNKSQRRSESAN
jgi:AhpD family alkylhydroperoxidase